MSKKKNSKKSTATEEAPMFSAHIPEAVQQQGSDADDALEAISEPIIDNPSEPTPADPDAVTKEPVNDPVKEPVKDPDAEPIAEGNKDWEHKFNVLKGKYEVEAKSKIDLEAENNSLKELSENQGQVLAAQAQAAIQSKQAETDVPVVAMPAAPDVDALDVNEFKSYGDEIEVLATRVNMLTDLIKGLIESGGGPQGIDPKRLDKLEQTVQVSAEEKYFHELDALVPNWREIDNSAAWKSWLNKVDEVSLYRHGDMLRNAAQNYRYVQVAAIFKKYAAETGVDAGIATEVVADPVTTVGNSNIVDETHEPLATQSMPDQTVAGGDVPVKQEFPTKDEYNKAVKDYTAKKITLDQFNEIANRYQMGIAAAQKAQ